MFGGLITHVVATWGLVAVFGLLTLEGLGLFFVPGETALIAAALVAGATHQLAIESVLLAGWAGALLGDNGSYWIGHRFGFGLIRRYGPYVHINEHRLKFVQYLYLRYGAPIVFIGRFITVLRSWEAFLAGANGMAWKRFAPVNAAASLLWVCLWGLGAFFLGQASESIFKPLGIGILVLFCILFVVGWRYFRRNEPALLEQADRALPGPLQPHRAKDIRAEAIS